VSKITGELRRRCKRIGQKRASTCRSCVLKTSSHRGCSSEARRGAGTWLRHGWTDQAYIKVRPTLTSDERGPPPSCAVYRSVARGANATSSPHTTKHHRLRYVVDASTPIPFRLTQFSARLWPWLVAISQESSSATSAIHRVNFLRL